MASKRAALRAWRSWPAGMLGFDDHAACLHLRVLHHLALVVTEQLHPHPSYGAIFETWAHRDR